MVPRSNWLRSEERPLSLSQTHTQIYLHLTVVVVDKIIDPSGRMKRPGPGSAMPTNAEQKYIYI